MRKSPRAAGATAVAIGLTLALAACGSSTSSGSGSKGGTLKIVGESENPSYDWSGAYDSASYSTLRAYTRQLYTNPSSNNADDRFKVVADIADGMPTMSSDGKTYTIKLKSDVAWNVGGQARAVTAQDAARGIKMLCNPATGSGVADYFTGSVVGMKDFCTGFGAVDGTKADAIKNYEEGKNVAGVQAVDAETLKITLTDPASDFLHYLTLPAASPRPIEMMAYVPDSPDSRQHLISDGPYMVAGYVPDKSFTLVRNPLWKASTDSTRKAYVDRIETTYGGTSDSIQQQIEAGTADLAVSNEPVPTASLSGLLRQNSPQLHVDPTGGPRYAVFNLVGTNAAMKNLAVRQAVSYAINKSAIAQQLGGTRVEKPIGQIFTESAFGAGFKAIDPYATKDSAGDTAKAKQLLSQAGVSGVTIKLAYPSRGVSPKIATSIQTDLEAAGIKVEPVSVNPSDYFRNFLGQTSVAKAGKWDVALLNFTPDWEGAAQRSMFSQLLDGRGIGAVTANVGNYNNDAVNKLADAAVAATSQNDAASKWNEVDAKIMADAPWVPLVEDNQANFTSSRLKNFQYQFTALNADITNVSVS